MEGSLGHMDKEKKKTRRSSYTRVKTKARGVSLSIAYICAERQGGVSGAVTSKEVTVEPSELG